MKSPLIWFGGKQKLAPHIIPYFPDHHCYVEPFGGGAGVLAAKEPVAVEVYNDIDDDVVNCLMVMREDPQRLADALESLPYARSLYERWKWEERPTDPFEWAVRWFYLNRSAVSSGNNHRSGWRHGSSVNPAKDFRSAIALLNVFRDRMRNVQIEKRDAREVILAYDSPRTLHYVDPPYPGNERRYKGGWTREDHIQLADLLETVKGKVIVSYYPDDLIDHLYFGWHRVEIKSHAFSRVQIGEEREERTELLLMNFEPAREFADQIILELA